MNRFLPAHQCLLRVCFVFAVLLPQTATACVWACSHVSIMNSSPPAYLSAACFLCCCCRPQPLACGLAALPPGCSAPSPTQ
jgi:hypothetical protein